ncbi:nucleotidyl transferase AbiEii/AbiGii toxin family protein, partial [Streptomyces fructofermentans]
LPAAFTVPGSDWRAGYPKQVALVLGLRGCDSLAEAAEAAAGFMDPILIKTAIRRWNPLFAAWV